MSDLDNLKGKTILIGKEPDKGRLLVSVIVNGQPKSAAIGETDSVPNSVSRCIPADGTAHCIIVVDQAANMVLTNLKQRNVTFVNGLEIASKKIRTDSKVELGKNRYAVNVSTILQTASKIVATAAKPAAPKVGPIPKTGPTPKVGPISNAGPPPGRNATPAEVSIRHLEYVWNEYQDETRRIKIRQKNNALLASVPTTFMMLGGIIAAVSPELRQYALIFTGIALVISVIGLYRRFTDNSIKETERITEEFQHKYVCPNKQCGCFLGMQPYLIVKQRGSCPYCKAPFKE